VYVCLWSSLSTELTTTMVLLEEEACRCIHSNEVNRRTGRKKTGFTREGGGKKVNIRDSKLSADHQSACMTHDNPYMSLFFGGGDAAAAPLLFLLLLLRVELAVAPWWWGGVRPGAASGPNSCSCRPVATLS